MRNTPVTPSLRLRLERRDALESDALFQAGLFALLLAAIGASCVGCYLVFWRPLLGISGLLGQGLGAAGG